MDVKELGKKAKELRDQLRNDPDMRVRFFRWLGRSNVAKYSLSNALLMFVQRPNISFIASRGYWERENLSIPENITPIEVLKPADDVKGKFEVVELFDAADVGAIATPPEPSYKRLGMWLWKLSNLPTITTSEHLVLVSILSYMGLTVDVEDAEKDELDMEAITEAYKAVRDIFFGQYDPYQEVSKVLQKYHFSRNQLQKLQNIITGKLKPKKEEPAPAEVEQNLPF